MKYDLIDPVFTDFLFLIVPIVRATYCSPDNIASLLAHLARLVASNLMYSLVVAYSIKS